MRKIFLFIGFLFFVGIANAALLESNTYYNTLQQFKIQKSTGDASKPINTFYYRGDFVIVNNTHTINIANVERYVILYATGTLWANRIETNEFITVSSQTIFNSDITANNITANYSLNGSTINLTSNETSVGRFVSNSGTWGEILIGTGTASLASLAVGYSHTGNYAFLQVFGEAQGEGIVIKDDSNIGIGTDNPGAKLDVNGDINYNVTGTDRVHNTSFESTKTSGNFIYFSTTTPFVDIDTVNLAITFPTAGTYLITANLRAHHDGDANAYAKIRLYNNTDAIAVSNSDRMLIEYQNASVGLTQHAAGFTWIVTVDSADTIYLQGYCTVANTAGIFADVNGYNTFNYIRMH